MPSTVIYDLLVILTAGLVSSLICRRLRVPVLIGYMLAGVLVGANSLGLVQEKSHDIEQLSEAGVFLLLFAIGLEFSLDELVRLGRHLVVGGAVQMVLVGGPVFGFLHVYGMDWRPAVLLASAVAFSSTVLVFRTLAEWGRTASPSGRRAIGILLFQDVSLVPLLLMVPLLAGGEAPSAGEYVILAVTSLAFVGSIVLLRWLLAEWFVPHLARQRSPELVVLAAVVALGAVVWAAHRVGLPPAVGALAAGLMLSGNRWTRQFDALLMPFRETFAVVFFVSLGLLLDPLTIMADPLWWLAMLTGLVLLKGAAATIALRLTRLTWGNAVGTGIGLAHVGEFAFVLVTFALEAELVTDEIAQQFVALALASLILSPLLLRLGMQRTEPPAASEEAWQRATGLSGPDYAIVIGIGPIGRRVASHLETTGYEVCLVDRSPLNLHPFQQEGFHAVAGEATEAETLRRAQAQRAALVVITAPDDANSLDIVRLLRRLNPLCKIVVRCRFHSNGPKLQKAGATEVISDEAHTGRALVRLLLERQGR